MTSWEQHSLTLAVSGDVRSIRIWDAKTEMKLQDIPSKADCCVSSLDTDGMGNMIVAGCGDGAVRLFDRRISPIAAKVMTIREHNAWVLGTYLRKSSNSSIGLITASSSGDVRSYDLRKKSSINCVQTMPGITAFTMHENADVFAW